MKTRNGFTLIEVLVTAAIIGMLGSLSFPTFSQTLDRAYAVDCLVTRRAVEHADGLYTIQKGSAAPSIAALYAEKYLNKDPKCPAGGNYVWVADQGSENSSRTLGCSVHFWKMDSPSGVPLYTTGFDDMDGLDLLKGKWRLKNGALVPVPGIGDKRLAFGDEHWRDYTIDLNATLAKGDGYGIFYRANGEANMTGYLLQYDPTSKTPLTVSKMLNGEEQAPIQSAALPKDFPFYNQSHDVSVTVDGDRHTISIDGQQMMDFHDSTFSSGGGGLNSKSNAQSSFDSLTVTQAK